LAQRAQGLGVHDHRGGGIDVGEGQDFIAAPLEDCLHLVQGRHVAHDGGADVGHVGTVSL
jgi:hypothetical protein